MPCARCDSLPTISTDAMTLLLWPPLGHTRGRVMRWAVREGLTHALDPGTEALALHLPEERVNAALEGLSDLLSRGEVRDTRGLALPLGETPSARHLRHVCSLTAILGRRKGAWLVDMLSDGRVFSHFQPIVHAQEPDRIHAHEALLRGLSDQGAPIGAGPILEAAQASDLLFQTDLAARRAAVRGFAEAGIPGKVFINFSPTAIYDPNYCLRSTIALVRDLGIAPGNIVFEVIESERHQDLDHLRRILDVYRDAGFLVALDDFGAGYSTYQVLDALGPDYVKLDRSLVTNVHAAPRKQMILRHVIDLCRGLGPKILAEGVEREAEAQWLREAGVDFMQGYLFGKPAPARQRGASPGQVVAAE